MTNLIRKMNDADGALLLARLVAEKAQLEQTKITPWMTDVDGALQRALRQVRNELDVILVTLVCLLQVNPHLLCALMMCSSCSFFGARGRDC